MDKLRRISAFLFLFMIVLAGLVALEPNTLLKVLSLGAKNHFPATIQGLSGNLITGIRIADFRFPFPDKGEIHLSNVKITLSNPIEIFMGEEFSVSKIHAETAIYRSPYPVYDPKSPTAQFFEKNRETWVTALHRIFFEQGAVGHRTSLKISELTVDKASVENFFSIGSNLDWGRVSMNGVKAHLQGIQVDLLDAEGPLLMIQSKQMSWNQKYWTFPQLVNVRVRASSVKALKKDIDLTVGIKVWNDSAERTGLRFNFDHGTGIMDWKGTTPERLAVKALSLSDWFNDVPPGIVLDLDVGIPAWYYNESHSDWISRLDRDGLLLSGNVTVDGQRFELLNPYSATSVSALLQGFSHPLRFQKTASRDAYEFKNDIFFSKLLGTTTEPFISKIPEAVVTTDRPDILPDHSFFEIPRAKRKPSAVSNGPNLQALNRSKDQYVKSLDISIRAKDLVSQGNWKPISAAMDEWITADVKSDFGQPAVAEFIRALSVNVNAEKKNGKDRLQDWSTAEKPSLNFYTLAIRSHIGRALDARGTEYFSKLNEEQKKRFR